MNYERTEWCSECDREVTLSWDIEKDGYCCYCPYCGKRLMLCQYCDGAADGECDWKENGGCKHSPENESRKENKMTKTEIEIEIENKIYDLKRVIESCKNVIKANENEIKKLEAEKEKPAFERVKKGEKYYFIGEDCRCGNIENRKIITYFTFDDNSKNDEKHFKSNNYFLTKERADEVADKINFLLKLERLHDTFCPDYKPDWEEEKYEYKWYIRFDSKKKKYTPFWTSQYRDATVYFDSKETAKKVCEILNKVLENEDM